MTAKKIRGRRKATRRKIKIVLVGAGSASFGTRTVIDAFGNPDLNKLDVDLVLFDVDARNVEAVHAFARLVKDRTGSGIRLSTTTDRREALKGADYVVTSVARHRNELWALDFRIPLALGFRHVYGENGGPGGAFHTLRSLELMVPIAKDMEKLCPKALLLNYTNPESRVCLAVNKLTRVQCVGLCHGVMATILNVARILRRPVERLKVTAAGINHFHWVLKVRDAGTGKDLYPALKARVDRNPGLLTGMTRRLWELFGLMPFPADCHTGEYLQFAFEFQGVNAHWGRPWEPVRLEGVELQSESGVLTSHAALSRDQACERLAPYLKGKKRLTKGELAVSQELAIPIVCDIELDLGRREYAVNVANTNGAIENLPRHAIVEVPAVVDCKGIHPEQVGPLPEAIAELCRRQTAIQDHLVEAYRTRSRKILLQALLLDPIVDSVDRAEQLIRDMEALQGDFLPKFE